MSSTAPPGCFSIDVADASDAMLGRLIYGLVVPRPIAWVSTVSADGGANLAPHSFFNAVSSHPPILMFASTHAPGRRPGGRKDTLRNLEATGEFVVHIVSEDALAPMVATSADVAAHVDEFELGGLQKAPSVRVRPPRVAAAKVAFECRLHDLIEVGDATAAFGTVVFAHVASDVWNDGRPDLERLRPVARLGGTRYALHGRTVEMARPK